MADALYSGVLVPPLLLLAALAAWTQLSHLDFNERHKAREENSWGEVLAVCSLFAHCLTKSLASNVLVQIPINFTRRIARGGAFIVALLMFFDLSFDLGAFACVYLIVSSLCLVG